jgi:hypothetical protein
VKYEYTIVQAPSFEENRRTLLDELNDMGDKGWQLVVERGPFFVMMREKKQVSGGIKIMERPPGLRQEVCEIVRDELVASFRCTT